MNAQLLAEARKLSVDDRIELVEAIWDSIATPEGTPALTDVQAAELHRRLADHLANPDDVVPWNDVRAEALAQLQR